MADIFDRKTRSKIMSSIKSKDTKAEIILRQALWKSGLRYRVHYGIQGKPDIVFVSKKLAIFVDGCFWHRCPDCFRMPKSNKKYWKDKIKGNVKRDKIVGNSLASQGWSVLRFYECEIGKEPGKAVKKIKKKLCVTKRRAKC